jgi:hypothetical protein
MVLKNDSVSEEQNYLLALPWQAPLSFGTCVDHACDQICRVNRLAAGAMQGRALLRNSKGSAYSKGKDRH